MRCLLAPRLAAFWGGFRRIADPLCSSIRLCRCRIMSAREADITCIAQATLKWIHHALLTHKRRLGLPLHQRIESRNSAISFCCHLYRQKPRQINTQWYERRFSKKPTVQTIFNDWLWKAGTLTCNKRLLTDVNKYWCLTNYLSTTKTKLTNEIQTDGSYWQQKDRNRPMKMTNFARVFQPMPLRLNWLITFNGLDW